MDPFASTAADSSGWLGIGLGLVTVLAVAVAVLAFSVGVWMMRESRRLTSVSVRRTLRPSSPRRMVGQRQFVRRTRPSTGLGAP